MYLVSTCKQGEAVERKHADFVWLHQQLRREYPGLRLPSVPDNNLESVTEFMEGISKNDILFGSFLTKKFCVSRDETASKEFAKARDLAYPEPDGLEKFRTFFSEPAQVTKAELEAMSLKAASLPNADRSMTADYDLFAESLLETCTSISVFMGGVKKNLREIEQSMTSVADKFREIASTTQSIITLLKRLNFAKTQFPLFDESQLNLDILFLKLKTGFENAGGLTSEGVGAAESGG